MGKKLTKARTVFFAPAVGAGAAIINGYACTVDGSIVEGPSLQGLLDTLLLQPPMAANLVLFQLAALIMAFKDNNPVDEFAIFDGLTQGSERRYYNAGLDQVCHGLSHPKFK